MYLSLSHINTEKKVESFIIAKYVSNHAVIHYVYLERKCEVS